MTSKHPRILIPLGIETRDKGIDQRNFARVTYIKKATQYGLIPIFVSPEMTGEMIDALYTEAHGALFMGGSDIDPSHYGEKPHSHTKSTPARDRVEIDLLKRCMRDRKPFLGICRGAQVLAVASGGSLHQHIPDLGIDEIHEPEEDLTYTHLLGDPKHKVIIDPDSRAFEYLGKREIEVNSSHHQAVKNIGADLRISGRSPGGIAEVIEHREKSYFCFAVQSHPEVFEESVLEIFFAEFAKAVKK